MGQPDRDHEAMKTKGRFSGLIFDFNGVLLWDDDLQRKSWRQFGTRFRDKPLSDHEIDHHVHGRNNQYTLEYLLGYALSQNETQALTEEKEIVYRQMCLDLEDEFKLSPGAIDLLSNLREHKIPYTIATASKKSNVDFFIRHLKLDTWFDTHKIVYDNGRIPGKPAPDFYLQAARNLELAPWECVVIEDSYSGIKAAQTAEVGCIIALGPRRNHQVLGEISGVQHVIENLSQVPVNDLFLVRKSVATQ